jgi:hypothetical protein
MNIAPFVLENVKEFSNDSEILLMLIDDAVQESAPHIRGTLAEMFKTIDANSPQIKKDWIEEILREMVYYDDSPPLFRVNRGEDFSIRIDLEEGRDFTGFNLTIRRADDSTLLSPNDTAGQSYTQAPTQYAYITDLDLTYGEVFKVHVLLENTDGSGLANGDAATLLTNAYLLVDENIG